MDAIRVNVRLDHRPDRVWEAITRPELLRSWLLETDFEPVVGKRCRFIGEPAPGFDGKVEAVVLEVNAPQRLVYSWKGGWIDTVVTYTVTPCRDGTSLLFEQSGFNGWRAALVRIVLAHGAKTMLRKRLPAVLDDMADPTSDGLSRGLRSAIEQDCTSHPVRSALGSAANIGAKSDR